MCTWPAARYASLIVGMEFTIESCVRGHHFSKEFYTPEVGEDLACLSKHEEGDSSDVYVVAVNTSATRTVQIRYDNDLSSFQLHFIIKFLPTEP